MKRRLLNLLKIRERPDPPPGPAGSIEPFRASPRYLTYTVVLWFPKQAAAFFGLVASLAFFGAWDGDPVQAEGLDRLLELLGRIPIGLGFFELSLSSFFTVLEVIAVLAFAAQFLFTGLLLKVSWELRWYMVGDRALRIREGLWRVREQTMTIANIQNMSVRQGPLQRLLGIADLEIRTAGGGGRSDASSGSSGEDSSGLHVGRLRGLENAYELRDRIRARLLRHRGAGLGDADDEVEAEAGEEAAGEDEPLAAARELVDEVRALRAALAAGAPGDRG